MVKMKSVILLSGNGSNFKNILDHVKNGYLNMQICAVISDNENAYGLQRAKDENYDKLKYGFYCDIICEKNLL